MIKHVCNMCGKDFNEFDRQEAFGFVHDVGYGSEYDGSRIRLDLCCNCFDKLMSEYIVPKCKISPVEDDCYGLG